jgi:glycosyltransferase involved in cell wall biosynthesis
MRLHVVALPHTEVTKAYEWCAYTAKTRKFCDMMYREGCDVILYHAGDNVQVIPGVACQQITGPPAHKASENWVPDFNVDQEPFLTFNKQAIDYLRINLEPKDFICLIGGAANAPIAEAFPEHQVVEYGIGYGGIIADTYHIFESYAWMHAVLAAGRDAHSLNGQFFDTVIPNYWDIGDFPIGDQSGDYLLYVGRLIERKGLQIALDVAQRTGLPLHVAGSGDFKLPNWVNYHGVVSPALRGALMGSARCILTPTLYIEPFGGVAVEAQLCGTPAITTDWGAFPETVEQNLTGYRCHTLSEFVTAVEDVADLDNSYIRRRAISKYSTTAIGPRYTHHFNRLLTLWDQGFYEI